MRSWRIVSSGREMVVFWAKKADEVWGTETRRKGKRLFCLFGKAHPLLWALIGPSARRQATLHLLPSSAYVYCVSNIIAF